MVRCHWETKSSRDTWKVVVQRIGVCRYECWFPFSSKTQLWEPIEPNQWQWMVLERLTIVVADDETVVDVEAVVNCHVHDDVVF